MLQAVKLPNGAGINASPITAQRAAGPRKKGPPEKRGGRAGGLPNLGGGLATSPKR